MTQWLKYALTGLVVIVFALGILGAYSHLLLPAGIDECQLDMSHLNHVAELPAFHCLGHSEWNVEHDTWDHLHPWMTEEWHRERKMDESHATSR